MPEERINSPEQLNDYIHVTTPGAWLILSSILIFLAGFAVWIAAGRLEVSFTSYVYADGASVLGFVTPDDASRLEQGMTVRLAESSLHGTVQHVDSTITPYSGIISLVGETNAIMMGIKDSDKLLRVALNINDAPERVSRVVYVVNTVKPLSFLLR